MKSESRKRVNDIFRALEKEKVYRILLVIESGLEAYLIRSRLSNSSAGSCDVVHSESLESCYGELAKGGADLVLLDVAVLQGQGDDAFHELFDLIECPCVVLADASLDYYALECVSMGAVDSVKKGEFKDGALEKCLSHALEVYRLKKEIQSLNRKMENSKNAKHEFLSLLSHEIKTPMNGVLGGLDLLDVFELEDDVRDVIDLARESASNHMRFMNDLLEIVSLEDEEIENQEHSFKVEDLLGSVVESIAFDANSKNIEITISIGRTVPKVVVADEKRIRLALLNLVGNAVKFTDVGQVSIYISMLSANEMEFTVMDTGIGVAEEKLDLIFEAFYQVDASMTRRFKGAGLGLAVFEKLVKAMGGEMGFSSEPEVGSEFRFTVKTNRKTRLK